MHNIASITAQTLNVLKTFFSISNTVTNEKVQRETDSERIFVCFKEQVHF